MGGPDRLGRADLTESEEEGHRLGRPEAQVEAEHLAVGGNPERHAGEGMAAVEQRLEGDRVCDAGQAENAGALAQPNAGRFALEAVVQLDLLGDGAPEVVVRIEEFADAQHRSHPAGQGCHTGCHAGPRIADASSCSFLGWGFVSLS